ncbi:MAG: AsmA family protein, partial [Candidatus Omnitrophica bacterium]|nr:AsmA family protein [Candidatus Omnitrophota bacterium]
MKKIFFLVFGILILAVAGVTVFVATFDADRYRPFIVREMERFLDKPVRLEKVALTWRQGLALELKGLEVFSNSKAGAPRLLELKSAHAVVDLTALLSKKVLVTSVIIHRPVIVFGIESKEVTTPAQQTSSVKAESRVSVLTPPGAAALLFLIQRVQVVDGLVSFRSEYQGRASELAAKKIDITVQDVMLNRPIPVKMRASLLSDKQNVDVSGFLRFVPSEGIQYLEDARLKLDLDTVSLGELTQTFPELKDLGLYDFSGHLEGALKSLKMGPDGASDFQATVELSGGRLDFSTVPSAVEDLNFRVSIQKNETRLENLSARFGSGDISMSGRFDPNARMTVWALNAAQIELEKIAPSADVRLPCLRGFLSSSFQGTSREI